MTKNSFLRVITFFAILSCCIFLIVSGESSGGRELLSGGGAAGSAVYASESVSELVIWTGFESREQDTLRAIARKFGTDSGINVRVEHIPFYELKMRVLDEAKLGSGPDIIICPNDWIGGLAHGEAILPLSESEFSVEMKKEFNPVGVEAAAYDGKTWGIPFFLETVGIFYNKKLVKKQPSSFSELIKQASAYHNPEKGKHGLLLEADNFYMTWPVFSGFGTRIFKIGRDGILTDELNLDSAESRKAIAFLRELVVRHGFVSESITRDEIDDLFMSGQVMYCVEGPWVLKKFRRSLVDFGIMDFPEMEGGKYPRPFVGVYVSLLGKNTRCRKTSLQFIHHLTSRDNQKVFCSIDNRIPSRDDVLESMKDYPEIRAFAAIARRACPLPNHPAVGCIWDPMKDALRKIVFEGSELDKVLSGTVREIQDNIEVLMKRDE